MKLIFALMILPALTGCASYFKRKECEKTNWHEYGKSVAMSGRRLSGDHFVQSCEKVEAQINYSALDLGFKSGMANYCLPETVYATGRSGQAFNPHLCDGSDLKLLGQKHQEGVVAFCQPDNGYRVGAQGAKYAGICPQNLESAFLKQFDQGRKIYLKGQIEHKENEIEALEKQISENQKLLAANNKQLALLPVIRALKKAKGKKKADVYTPEEQRLIDERQRLNTKITGLENQVKADRNRQNQLRNEIGSMRTEMMAIR